MSQQKLKIAIACDHAGFDYKEALKQHLKKEGFDVTDYGTNSLDSVDYPDFVHPLAKSIVNAENQFGILICGSANGVAVTANKYAEIRAAICWADELASLCRQHNNANVICIPARFVSLETAIDMTNIFLNTAFEGGRHQTRVDKITNPSC
jgi:ribose 5-phosphate isomerase B